MESIKLSRLSKWIGTFLVVLLTGTTMALAQPDQNTTPNDTLVSPEVFPDNQVRFSIYAPEANQVTVSGESLFDFEPRELSKDENGVWSVTHESLDPGIYSYIYTVDGVQTIDPQNNWIKQGPNSLDNLFMVPGEEAEFMTLKSGPHGTVEKVWYESGSLETTRRMHIYLPPGYNSENDAYPVLYLLHGAGGTDVSWTLTGQANFILDNLLAEGEIVPMVVVMPNGHTPVEGNPMGAGPEEDPFYRDFLNDIKPYVENNYNVSTERANQAIAGLSMGGMQTLNIALFNPELFGYVLPLSTGFFPQVIEQLENEYTDVLQNPELNNIELFRFSIGTEDFLYENNQAVMTLLDQYGVNYEYDEFPGRHVWGVWRDNLHTFAPMLFK